MVLENFYKIQRKISQIFWSVLTQKIILQIDPLERSVRRGNRDITLSRREFDLLTFLVRHADAVQSRQSILDAVWGTPFVGDPNTLDVYMGYLRKKVERCGEPQMLHTLRGIGFMARVGEAKP